MAHNKKYSVKQRIQMVWFYAETKSISLTQTKFVKHFDLDRKHGKPSKHTILAVVNKFLATGSVLDAHRIGRQKTGRSMANIDAIRRAILKKSKRSIRYVTRWTRDLHSGVSLVMGNLYSKAILITS